MTRLKANRTLLQIWRRLTIFAKQAPLWAWIVLGFLAVASVLVLLSMVIVNGRYRLSPAQATLLSAPGIDTADLKETATSFTYNMADDLKDDPMRQLVTA